VKDRCRQYGVGSCPYCIGKMMQLACPSGGYYGHFYDLNLIEAIRQAVDVPIIASGGAGKLHHFAEAIRAGADAVLAASVFHFDIYSISQVKEAIEKEGFPVRKVW